MKSASKSFDISKQEVWDAYVKVRTNGGAPGVDGCSMDEFDADLKNNLYKIWNRMSSGSYFPPAVREVQIPKPHGAGVRTLGVPTIADRIAQTVVAARLEERLEPVFHPDSYGYRPNRSALDAVGTCRRRCWTKDWVLDVDVAQFFDTVDHDLMLKAVAAHTELPWVLLYVRRWLTAAVQAPDGSVTHRDRGTPQGSAVSPVLANLFMHYAFDMWMVREFPTVPFERYADDVVVHCVSQNQADRVYQALENRMAEVGLRLHPDKTKIVYCKDGKRGRDHAHTEFTFLGFTFRARAAQDRNGKMFTSFLPAISKDAVVTIGARIRSWRLHRRTGMTLKDLRRLINPVIRGWMQYYGVFYRTALYPLLKRINTYLVRWLRNTYKRLRGTKRSIAAYRRVTKLYPHLFAHWKWVHQFV